jgi:hypothetical protein
MMKLTIKRDSPIKKGSNMMITEIDGLKHQGKYKDKTQIVLTHTSRPLKYYISSIKNRYNGNYDKIPHFIISKEGKIYSLIPTTTYSNILPVRSHNKRVIIITLENLGWLKKIPLKNYYVNWIGDKTEGEIYEKKWRGYFLWEKYTETQIDSLVKLTKFLESESKINNKCIGHNVKVDFVEKFSGITSLSNYDINVTSLSPAFDFDLFIDKIESYDE